MKLWIRLIITALFSFTFPSICYAAGNAPAEITTFTQDTLKIITMISAAAAAFFLIRAGYIYITSTGNPQALEDAKKTIRNAIIGLTLVLVSSSLVSLLNGALSGEIISGNANNLPIIQVEAIPPSDGLGQVLIDAVNGFLRNLLESATKPIVDAILTFLATTPTLLDNSTIVKFWLIMLGITDSLFIIVIALLGLGLMSATTFGFEAIEFKHLLPRIGLAFLGANVSLFLADYVIKASNALVSGVISATGGLNHAMITNSVDILDIITLNNETNFFIVYVFLLIFLIVSIVLLIMYVSRLIVISLGAVLSPFIFLLWVLPKTESFADMAVKSYFVSVFTIFIHVVTIQLASAFLTLPEQSNNSLISLAVGIGLLFTFLKTPAFLMHLVSFSTQAGAVAQIGSRIINVVSTSQPRSSNESNSNDQTKSNGERVEEKIKNRRFVNSL